jgi:bacterial/archaeal transporter family protein
MGRFAMSLDYRLLLFSGLAILLWEGWGFFGKLALDKNMAPTSLFLAEVGISAVCAAPVWWLLVRQPEAAALSLAWNMFGLASGAGLALGLLCYYVALETSHASIVVPLTAVYPAVSVLLSYALLDERPTGAQWAGIVFVIVGAILLLSGPIANISHE